MTDSIISNNGIAVDVAAGMMNFGVTRLERVLFAGNKASSYGGGLHNQGTLWLENVTFRGIGSKRTKTYAKVGVKSQYTGYG
ncbi:MAG: hypothetical protein HND44_24620 [Chloroflexi bacterium]|nr:hypothetical protein [Chloroflexota bacterium]